ncbi:outer membrane beta-barrel protein [Yoonia sp. BS5-3]|uniref:Outer membrane protein n=1 Tax=Yoonia phaeophyticola TaxID=3137369 RepID=A0ABZ2V0G5_9RHOB
MKIVQSLALAGIALLPTSAFADWAGGYLGGSLGVTATDEAEQFGVTEFETENHNPIGFFAGYQAQSNQFVYGAEYAVSFSAVEANGADADAVYGDLKFRAGYDLGQILPYALLSVSAAVFSDDDDDTTASGLGFGAGVDYAVSDNFVVGGEFIFRAGDSVEVDGLEAPDASVESTALSVRAAYKF